MANERHVFKKLIDIDYQTLVSPKFRLKSQVSNPWFQMETNLPGMGIAVYIRNWLEVSLPGLSI